MNTIHNINNKAFFYPVMLKNLGAGVYSDMSDLGSASIWGSTSVPEVGERYVLVLGHSSHSTLDRRTIERHEIYLEGMDEERGRDRYGSILKENHGFQSYLHRLNLRKKIDEVYLECRDEDWDGYGAIPISHSNYERALEFFRSLLLGSGRAIEEVDIIPENEGNLCFEWFKAKDRLISISVTGDKLIFNYKIEDSKGCGEISSRQQMILKPLIEKVINSHDT